MMAMNFKFRVPNCLRSVRYVLAAVNGVFLATGLVLLGVGIAVLVRYTEYDAVMTNRFFNLANFVIATAVIIIVGSALGFYGAISRHFYVVGAYLILLLVVLVFEISIIIVGFLLSNDAVWEIRTPMIQTIQLYGISMEKTELWDNIQLHFQCCGVFGHHDWITSLIPVSCCFMDYGRILEFKCSTANAYNWGCAVALGEYLAHQAYVVATTATVVTSIQVILVSLVAYLTWQRKREEAKWNTSEPTFLTTKPPVATEQPVGDARVNWRLRQWDISIISKPDM